MHGRKILLWAPMALLIVLLCRGTAKGPLLRKGAGGGLPPQRPAPTRSTVEFRGTTLDGRQFDFAAANKNHRMVVYLFTPTAQYASSATQAAERLHQERHEHNLCVVGVVAPAGFHPFRPKRVSSTELTKTAESYMAEAGATFPCVVDPIGHITSIYMRNAARRFREVLPAFVMFPVRGQGGGGGGFLAADAAKSSEPADYLYRNVLKSFGIEPAGAVEPLAGDRPKAPAVSFVDTTGATHRVRAYRGHVVVVVFMVTRCPMCKDELTFLQKMLKSHGGDGEGSRLRVLAVCIDAKGEALERFVRTKGYDFPVCSDDDWAIRTAFGYRGSTPDTFVIAPNGTVRSRHRDHTRALDRVLEMEIRALLGLETKPLFGSSPFNGDRTCRVCHPKQHDDWTLTRHACAWDTLVRTGKQNDPKCIKCHVVGYREPGGFNTLKTGGHLTDVQCEACHGGNGCSAYTGRPVKPVGADVCAKCHDAKHSPRFDFAAARPRVLHTRADALAKLPRAEREKHLKALCAGASRELFDPNAAYVGSAKCGECHPTAYKALQGKPHAEATTLLVRPARTHWSVPRHKQGITGMAKPECFRCHVTGYGRPGGFPTKLPAEEPARHAMAGVGCEACHGPGKAHADDPKKARATARLGGTCNECNVLPICRQCHDDANSPDFDYRTALPKAQHPAGEKSEGYK